MKGNLKRRPIVVEEDRAPVDSFEIVDRDEMYRAFDNVWTRFYESEREIKDKLKMLYVVGSVIAGALLVMILRKDDK